MEGGPGWPAAPPTGVLFERAATLPSCSRDCPFILRTQESTALEIPASRAQTQTPARMGGGAEGAPGSRHEPSLGRQQPGCLLGAAVWSLGPAVARAACFSEEAKTCIFL